MFGNKSKLIKFVYNGYNNRLLLKKGKTFKSSKTN